MGSEMCIRDRDYHGNGVDAEIENFLMTVGRRWYVSTIFKAFKSSEKVEEALAIYKKSRANYHSVTVNTIDELLSYKPNKYSGAPFGEY